MHERVVLSMPEQMVQPFAPPAERGTRATTVELQRISLNDNGGNLHVLQTFDKGLGQHGPRSDQDHAVVPRNGLFKNHVRFGQGQGNFLHGCQSAVKGHMRAICTNRALSPTKKM